MSLLTDGLAQRVREYVREAVEEGALHKLTAPRIARDLGHDRGWVYRRLEALVKAGALSVIRADVNTYRPRAWQTVEDATELKACPDCGEATLEDHEICPSCGTWPIDDTTWRQEAIS